MSETINSLSQEEQEILLRLEAIREKKKILEEELEAILVKEQGKEIVFNIVQVSGANFIIESLARTDVLEMWKSIPRRQFRGYKRKDFGSGSPDETPGRNLIPIKEWEETKEKMEALPNTSIEWTDEAKEKYDWLLSAPGWEVDVTTHRGNLALKATAGPESDRNSTSVWKIPGSHWNWSEQYWLIPISEGWRIFECLQDVKDVVYTEVAKTLILEQIECRGRLDEIAQQENSDDPRILQLVREVWNENKQTHEPFHDWLLPFQKVGIEFGLECGTRFVLGDKTGLGKTGQAIAIAELLRLKDPEMQIVCEVKGANIRNWVREIRNLAGEEPAICINTKKEKTEAYFKIIAEKVPYILISHDMLGTYDEEVDEQTKEVTRKYTWADLFKMIKPNLLIIDEAHLIKSPDANRTKATHQLVDIPHVILLTATPILNRTEEWWSLLHMTDPIMFRSHQAFKNHYTWDGQTARNVNELHDLLRPRFIQRLKKDVQKDLPPINRQTRIVELSKEAKANYNLALEGLYNDLAVYDPKGKGKGVINVQHILAQILRLKQICAAEKPDYVADLATELIDQSENGGKVLIFSYFKAIAYRIAQLLGDEAVCTVSRTEDDFVSMTSDKRDDLFQETKNNPDIKFIVTTEAAKEGHNLEFCDWVIFNDQFWTPAAHDQCEGRAYGRLANPHTIDVFNIIADVKIEEWMQELLNQKLVIIEEAVEGVESTRELEGSIVQALISKIKGEMYKT